MVSSFRFFGSLSRFGHLQFTTGEGLGGSSSGRTMDSGSINRGSNPCPPVNDFNNLDAKKRCPKGVQNSILLSVIDIAPSDLARKKITGNLLIPHSCRPLCKTLRFRANSSLIPIATLTPSIDTCVDFRISETDAPIASRPLINAFMMHKARSRLEGETSISRDCFWGSSRRPILLGWRDGSKSSVYLIKG